MTLSRVIPSCAGTGMVTICMFTRWNRSTPGWIRVSPGARTSACTRPNRNTTPRSNCRTTRSPATAHSATIPPAPNSKSTTIAISSPLVLTLRR